MWDNISEHIFPLEIEKQCFTLSLMSALLSHDPFSAFPHPSIHNISMVYCWTHRVGEEHRKEGSFVTTFIGYKSLFTRFTSSRFAQSMQGWVWGMREAAAAWTSIVSFYVPFDGQFRRQRPRKLNGRLPACFSEKNGHNLCWGGIWTPKDQKPGAKGGGELYSGGSSSSNKVTSE